MFQTSDNRVARHELVEVTHVLVLLRHRHRLEVDFVSDSLEIATNQKQVYLVFILCFEILNVTVYCVKLPMTAAFYSNLDGTLNNLLKCMIQQINLHFSFVLFIILASRV